MKKIMGTLLIIALIFGMARVAPAATAISFASPGNYNYAEGWSLGFKFSPESDICVTSLGYYDYFPDGISDSHPAGIYDSSGSLLLLATISSASYLEDSFRYEDVTSTLLTSGEEYYCMVLTSNADAYTWNPSGFLVSQSIDFLGTAVYSHHATHLTFPDKVYPEVNGFFGANFKFTSVPGPASILLLGSGLIGVAGIKRKFKK